MPSPLDIPIPQYQEWINIPFPGKPAPLPCKSGRRHKTGAKCAVHKDENCFLFDPTLAQDVYVWDECHCHVYWIRLWSDHCATTLYGFNKQNVYLFMKNSDYPNRYTWITYKWKDRSRVWLPCGRNCWKMWILMNPYHVLTMCTWDVLNVNANRKIIIKEYTKIFESRISAGATEKLSGWKSLTRKLWRGPMTWKDMLKHALSDTVNQQTRMWSNFTQSFKSLLGWSSI